MIVVAVTQDNDVNRIKVNPKYLCIGQNQMTLARIEKDALSPHINPECQAMFRHKYRAGHAVFDKDRYGNW